MMYHGQGQVTGSKISVEASCILQMLLLIKFQKTALRRSDEVVSKMPQVFVPRCAYH